MYSHVLNFIFTLFLGCKDTWAVISKLVAVFLRHKSGEKSCQLHIMTTSSGTQNGRLCVDISAETLIRFMIAG
jgi:hypothetical protein